MSNHTPVAELLRMTPDELRREIAMKRIEYAKMRMGIEIQKEKNHALFKTKRHEIARMETVMTQMRSGKAKIAVAPKTAAKTVEKAEIPVKKPSQAKRKSVKSTGSKSTKS